MTATSFVQVGVLAPLERATGVNAAHEFFGMTNGLKPVSQLKVSSFDFHDDRVTFEVSPLHHHSITQPTATTVVATFSLSQAPFGTGVALRLASELEQYVASSPVFNVHEVTSLWSIELGSSGNDEILRVVSFDFAPELSAVAMGSLATTLSRLQWKALNACNNALDEKQKDGEVRKTVRAAQDKRRSIAQFTAPSPNLVGLREPDSEPTMGVFTVALLVPSGELSAECTARVVDLYNIAVEKNAFVGVVQRTADDAYGKVMGDLSKCVDVVYVDSALEGAMAEVLVELAPFIAEDVAICNHPSAIQFLIAFDPDDCADDEDGAMQADAPQQFHSPCGSDVDVSGFAFKAFFVGAEALHLEVIAPVEDEPTLWNIPSCMSMHRNAHVTMPLAKVTRDAALIRLATDGPARFHEWVKVQLSKVIFPRGRPGSFGAIRMEQADMATIIGCSPGYVSGFVGSTANPDWGEKCNSFALELGYFAMRIDLTPTDIWSGLSRDQLEKMPTSADMATKSKKKQKEDIGPAVCGGRAPGNEEVDDYVKPMSFQGDSRVRADQRAYLIKCTTKKCDSNLTYAHQEAMCTNLFRIEKGLPPDVTDPPTPTMCPDFFARCVTANFKGATRMGIEQWWQSYGIEDRANHCNKRSRCGITSSQTQLGKTGHKPKFMHCALMKHKKRCPCPDCTSERELAAGAFGRRTAL